MTAKELKRKLTDNGWVITQGARHEQATHPNKPGVKVSHTQAHRRHSRRHVKQNPKRHGAQILAPFCEVRL